jgi:signal transduction histidine kinase
MNRWRPLALLALLALIGGLGTLLVGRAMGMGGSDLAHLAAYLAPAAAVTVAAVALATPLLSRASIRSRFAVVAVVGTVVGLANLFAVTRAMSVSAHDAALLSALLLYSVAAGVGAGLAIARSSATALERLARTAGELERGDLSARVGDTGGGPELDRLGAAFDRMAEGLETARDRERRVEAMRADLITAVSHDLRTPLASLRAMIEAVDDGVVGDPETIRRYASEMRRSVGQLSGMVDDLFELAQLDAGAIETETTRIALGDAVDAALATVEPTARAKGVRLETDLADAVGAACSPRVTRVLQTLLVNAVRHTPADGSVRVEARVAPAGVAFAVEDSGEGIAEDDLPRVFEPFYRGDAARSGPGAGLGLALAKRIVEALGGSIAARPDVSRGARFEVELPR